MCPIAAVQMPYNMLQRDIEQRTIPWCRERNIAVMVYWPLMKGLLAGKLTRDAELDERDSRRKYPMYQGDEWQRNQDFVDRLAQKPRRSPATPSPSSSSTGRSPSPASRPHCAAPSARSKSKKRPARWAGRSATSNVDDASTQRSRPAAQAASTHASEFELTCGPRAVHWPARRKIERVPVRIANRELADAEFGFFRAPRERHFAAKFIGEPVDALRETCEAAGERRRLLRGRAIFGVQNDRHVVAADFGADRFAFDRVVTGLREAEHVDVEVERPAHVGHEQAGQNAVAEVGGHVQKTQETGRQGVDHDSESHRGKRIGDFADGDRKLRMFGLEFQQQIFRPCEACSSSAVLGDSSSVDRLGESHRSAVAARPASRDRPRWLARPQRGARSSVSSSRCFSILAA